MAGRPSAGAAAVGAERNWREAGGEGCRRAPGRATGRESRIHRMARWAIDLVLGMALGRHFRRVGHAEEDSARVLQPLDRDCVARRDEVLIEQRAIGDAPAGDPCRVLYRVWHAEDGAFEAATAPRVD